jgi:hypothetical protein
MRGNIGCVDLRNNKIQHSNSYSRRVWTALNGKQKALTGVSESGNKFWVPQVSSNLVDPFTFLPNNKLIGHLRRGVA